MNLQLPYWNLLPREDYLSTSEPLVKTYQPTVNIEAKEARINVLIDEFIAITIDNPCCVERAKNADLLIIDTIFRPRQSDEPLKGDEILSLRKIVG